MSFADRLADWRNGLISSPKFQDWAVRNPLTRAVARQKSKAAFDLVAGFVYSQVLAAVIECRLLEAAQAAPVDAGALSLSTGLPPEGTKRLLRAAAALDLVRRRADGRYGLGEMGAALLGNPSVFAMIRHHKALYADLADPVALLDARSNVTALARFWAYETDASAGQAQAYSSLMAETQVLVAGNVLDAYAAGHHRCVMDVGGGLGAFLTAVGTRHAKPDLVLVDLPAVAVLAREALSATPLAARFRIEPRDFLKDPLPEGADLITLVRVVHDHDDPAVRVLLSSVRRALAPGGKLLIAEPMAGIRGVEAMGDAYFGLYLWAMGRGQPRRPDELKALLTEAGFTACRQLRTAQPLLASAIIAR